MTDRFAFRPAAGRQARRGHPGAVLPERCGPALPRRGVGRQARPGGVRRRRRAARRAPRGPRRDLRARPRPAWSATGSGWPTASCCRAAETSPRAGRDRTTTRPSTTSTRPRTPSTSPWPGWPSRTRSRCSPSAGAPRWSTWHVGGDLVQDMTETLGADHRHLVHDIEVLEDSPLRVVVPGDRMTISCYHHQGLGRLGEGLQASAYAWDGTIEAVGCSTTTTAGTSACSGIRRTPPRRTTSRRVSSRRS